MPASEKEIRDALSLAHSTLFLLQGRQTTLTDKVFAERMAKIEAIMKKDNMSFASRMKPPRRTE